MDSVDPIVEDDAVIAWARFDQPDVNADIDVDLAVVIPLNTTPISILPLSYLKGVHSWIHGYVLPALDSHFRPISQ